MAELSGESKLDEVDVKGGGGTLVVTTHRVRLVQTNDTDFQMHSAQLSEIVQTRVACEHRINYWACFYFLALSSLALNFYEDKWSSLNNVFPKFFACAIALLVTVVMIFFCILGVQFAFPKDVVIEISLRSSKTPITAKIDSLDEALCFIDNVELACHEWTKGGKEHAQRAFAAKRDKSPTGRRYRSIGSRR
jgi:hypothetical protein